LLLVFSCNLTSVQLRKLQSIRHPYPEFLATYSNHDCAFIAFVYAAYATGTQLWQWTVQVCRPSRLNVANMQVVVGSLAIKEILYSSKIRNALVVLADGTSRKQLESLEPDMERMVSELNTEQLNGVMVTCQGEATNVFPYCRLVLSCTRASSKSSEQLTCSSSKHLSSVGVKCVPVFTACVSNLYGTNLDFMSAIEAQVQSRQTNANSAYSVSVLGT